MQLSNRRVSDSSHLRAAQGRAYSRAVDAETREYLEAIRADLAAARRDMATKEDLASLATKNELAGAFAALDAKIDRVAADTRHQFEITAEGLRDQMKVLAEGIVMNAEALGRFRTEVIAEFHELRRGR